MNRWTGHVAMLLALFVVGGYVWSNYVSKPQDALCQTLIQLVQRSNDTIRKHPYYKAHPDQLPAALRENARTLHDLRAACP